MSNRLFQGIIHQMTDTVDRTIGVIDETGVIIACSELVKIGVHSVCCNCGGLYISVHRLRNQVGIHCIRRGRG